MAKKGSVSRMIVWVILGLLVVGLVGFGTSDFGGSVRTVATVGDTEVTTSDYARALQSEMRRINEQSGRTFSMSEAQAFGLDRAVLSRLVGEAALDEEAHRLGLSVGDAEVRDQVTSIPGFQGLDGSFDREAYNFTLDRMGLSVAEFEDQVRNETARNILRGAVTGALAVPPVYADTIYGWARETRDITWSRLTAEDLEEPLPEPSDEDLAAYHEAHAEEFTLGETKAITYAWLTPDMMLDTIEPDEEALRDLYQSRIDEYVMPERRLVERLVFSTEEAAEAAKARIDAGEATFDDLVEERGLSLEDVDLGEASRADLGAAADGVFGLSEPGLAGPLPSPLGPAIFRVNAILNASETPFEEVREELEAELAADRARRAIEDLTVEIDDLLAAGATLEDLADETEMELGQIDWRQGVTDGAAAYQGFRDAALLAEPNDFPELIELEEGGIVALRVDEVRPPELQPLDAVKPEVIAGWEEAEAATRLEAQAHAAADAIRGGAEMASLDLPLQTERGLTREAFIEGAPPAFVEGVFQMKPDDIRVFAAPGGAALVRLDAVNAPDQDSAEAQELKAGFSRQTEQEVANDVLQMYTGRLQARTAVQVNNQALNAVHAQFQ
jgi:peptidyl-prolyl cis-trans isomerase D